VKKVQLALLLADRVGISLGSSEDRGDYEERSSVYDALEDAGNLFERTLWGGKGMETAKARKYILDRGIMEQTARDFSLGYAPNSWDFLIGRLSKKHSSETLKQAGLVGAGERGPYDMFRGRVMFPIRALTGKIIGFGGRTIIGDERKYVNSPETSVFKKSRILYGLPEAQKVIRDSGRFVVCEGYTDMILAHQYGLCNFVATCGTAFTSEQAELIKRFSGSEVVLLFDGDEPGRKAAFNASKELIGRGNTSVCLLEGGKDPADILNEEGRRSLEEKLEKTVPLFDFYVDCQSKERDLSVPEEASAFLNRIAGDLRKVPPTLLGLYVDDLARRTGFRQESIEAVVFEDYEFRGSRGFGAEARLLRGLLEFQEARNYFIGRLSPEMFLFPETQALYKYLIDLKERVPLLVDRPLFDESQKIITELNERQEELDSEKLRILLTRRLRNSVKLDDLEAAYVEMLGNNTANLIEDAKKRGHGLDQIEQVIRGLKKELE